MDKSERINLRSILHHKCSGMRIHRIPSGISNLRIRLLAFLNRLSCIPHLTSSSPGTRHSLEPLRHLSHRIHSRCGTPYPWQMLSARYVHRWKTWEASLQFPGCYEVVLSRTQSHELTVTLLVAVGPPTTRQARQASTEHRKISS